MHPALRLFLSLCSALACGVVTGIGTAVGYLWTLQWVNPSHSIGNESELKSMALLAGLVAGYWVYQQIYERLGR